MPECTASGIGHLEISGSRGRNARQTGVAAMTHVPGAEGRDGPAAGWQRLAGCRGSDAQGGRYAAQYGAAACRGAGERLACWPTAAGGNDVMATYLSAVGVDELHQAQAELYEHLVA